MLREFDEAARSKDEFLSVYRPIRSQVEQFLKGGQKVDAANLKQVLEKFMYDWFSESGARPFPYYQRDVTVRPTSYEKPITISAKTNGFLYPHSDQIERSYIILSLIREGDQNGPLAVLPPIYAFEQDRPSYTHYLNTPQRVSEILPLLPRGKNSGTLTIDVN